MTPMNISAIIIAIEQLIGFILQAKDNGQLTDDELDAAVATTNQQTRDLIKQALSGQGPLASPAPPTT